MHNLTQTNRIDQEPTTLDRWLSRCTSRRALLGILAFGLLVRIKYFLEWPALWLDEAYVSLNILHRSYAELADSLSFNQVAPYGFLVVQKAVTDVLGGGELALRLFPMLSGLAAMVLFYFLVRRWLEPAAQPIALAMLACAGIAIWYSGQVKQYSSDVTIAIGLMLLADYRGPRQMLWGIGMAVTGAVAVWFSHPSVFILAGVGTSLFVAAAHARDWKRIYALISIGASWGASFVANYFLIIKQAESDTSSREFLVDFWGADGFPPLPPTSVRDIEWYFQKAENVFQNPGSLTFSGIALVFWLLGCMALFPKHKLRMAMMLLPLAFTFLAGGLHKYPVEGRLLLFYVPFMHLIVAAGAGACLTRTSRSLPAVGVIALALVMAWPAYTTSKHLIRPRVVSNIRPVLQHLGDNYQEGDVVYLKEWAQYNFLYYREKYGLEDVVPLVAPKHARPDDEKLASLDRLRGSKRAWIITDGPNNGGTIRLYLPYLDELGEQVDSLKVMNTHIYLYDLRNAPPADPRPAGESAGTEGLPAVTGSPTRTSEAGTAATGE